MVASPRLNSFMKSAIVFWCSATLGTSILENRSYSVRKMDHGRIECPPASATEIEKRKWIISSSTHNFFKTMLTENKCASFVDPNHFERSERRRLHFFSNANFFSLAGQNFLPWQVQIANIKPLQLSANWESPLGKKPPFF